MDSSHHVFLEIVLPSMAVAINDRILDLGCGDGWASRKLAALASEGMVVGIDSSGAAIREARRLSSKFENILYIEAEAEENPWQDNFFSLAVLIDTLSAVHDVPATLRHLQRVMSAGGQLWIVNQFARETGASRVPALEAGMPDAEEYLKLLRAAGLVEPGCSVADGGTAANAGTFLITAKKAF